MASEIQTNISNKVDGCLSDMQESFSKESDVDEETEDYGLASATDENKDAKQKNVRHRKRKFYNNIRSQMEFYLGDANLSKDRFLKKLIATDPFIPLEVFLKCNKIKKLQCTSNDIVNSLSNSELIELNEDNTKVRRKTTIPKIRNVDSKTLYVESLPPTANHEWLKNVFQRYGPVVYVSLPKYQKSGKIKEFGFIEFEQEASIEKSLKAFKEFNGVLCSGTTDPANLASIISYSKEKEETKRKSSKVTKENVSEVSEVQLNDSEVDEPPAKRIKKDSDNGETGDEISTACESEKDEINENEEDKKRKRRRKKKKKSEILTKPDADFYQIKILPKIEWRRLRNKYLNLQRERISEIKRLAWKNSERNHDKETSPKKSDLQEKTKKIEKMNMNFYGASQEDDEKKGPLKTDEKENLVTEKPPLFTLEPGLIVQVKFLEPCVNIKEFKTDMKQYNSVKYVDVKEGAVEAFLRIDTPQNAENFVKSVSCAEYNCKVITGDVEKEYWEKIKLDREMKLTKKIKFVPQKRGRDRVNKIISKHIRFDDNDN